MPVFCELLYFRGFGIPCDTGFLRSGRVISNDDVKYDAMTGATRRFGLLAVSLVTALLPRLAESADATLPGYVCTQDGATRSIVVVRETGYACRVKYTKPSGTTYPWSARNDADYCGPKAAGLAGKLGTFGWACDSAEDVKSVLLVQIERYGRHIRILQNVGKRCYFYPAEARYGNLCGDDPIEAAIVYTCDGADDTWEQHLAVFVDTEDEPLTRQVGDSRSRQVTGYYVDDNRLLLESEPVEPAADGTASAQPAATTAIRCGYDAAARWELIEQP